MAAAIKHFEFDITILGIKPKIWRRILLPADESFAVLSAAIQSYGPWYGYHLWEFLAPGRDRERIAGLPQDVENSWDDDPAPDARKVKLGSYFTRKGAKAIYWYDFGDSWYHEIKLGAVKELPDRQITLLDGARNFPPEDCGGTYGYYRCWVASGECNDPKLVKEFEKDEELADVEDWLGDWSPEEFNLTKLQAVFPVKKQLAKKKRKGQDES